MSSDLIAQIQTQLTQLGEHSSLSYAFGETPEGNPVILAGNLPVFRCRSDELGQAHAQLVVAAIPALAMILSGATAEAPIAHRVPEQKGSCGADVAAIVRDRIVSAVALQPDLVPKAGLMAKLIFAAVEPFLAGAGQQEGQTPERAQPVSAPVAQVAALRHEIAESLVDWLSNNAVFPLSDESFAAAITEWEASYAT